MPDETVSLATIEQEVTRISPLLSMDNVLLTHSRLQWLKGEVKRVADLCEAAMVEWVKTNGPIIDGTKSWVIGRTKKVKCRDVPATIEALLKATGGDFEKMCDNLSSGAVKHGAASKWLTPEEFDRLFEVSWDEGIELGKPLKLKMLDSQFVR